MTHTDRWRCGTRATLAAALMVGATVALWAAPALSAEAGRGGEPSLGESSRGSVGAWQGGHWYRGWHGDRYGWWWAVPGDDWYAYEDPIYPFPVRPDTGYPGAPTAPYYWYYCQNPVGYYPYVQQCTGPWRPVPAPG